MNKPCTKCKYYQELPFGTKKTCSKDEICEKIEKYIEYKQKRRKYKCGNEKITSFEQLEKHDMVFAFGKATHLSFIISMPYFKVRNMIINGSIYNAERRMD